MKISTRLIAGFGLLILLFILCTGIAHQALHHAREGMDDTVNIKMKKYQLAQSMYGEVRDMGIAVRNIALLSDTRRCSLKSRGFRNRKRSLLLTVRRSALSGNRLYAGGS